MTSHTTADSPVSSQEEHTDALITLARRAVGAELSPAAARAALRRAHLTSAEELADLAAGARALAEQVRALDVAAGTAARTAGMAPPELTERLGVSLRTVQGRYTYHEVILESPGGDLLALVDRDDRGRPRPVTLELNVRTKVLRLLVGAEPTTDADGAVHRWPVPLFTGPGGTALLQALKPLALRILVGTDMLGDRYLPDTDAAAAVDEIGRACDQAAHTYPVLWEADAATLWAAHDPTAVAAALGLSRGASTDQVAAAAELARTNALSRLCLLTGAEAYLAAVVTTPPPPLTPSPQPATALPDPALAPVLRDLVSTLGPVLATKESPLRSERLRQVCTELVDAVASADPARLARALDQVLAMEADPAELQHLPQVARPWKTLHRAAGDR
ncbi:hypothetical protein ACQEU5_24860 [Marinactinospora thermotolerans]|uniref:hypothetical protein n=1 Tax=Marinactinospora thermotolerans TaxID=531310 RepID=UPI003D8BAA96